MSVTYISHKIEYYTHNDVISCLFGFGYIPTANFLPEKHILEPSALDKKDEMGCRYFPTGCFFPHYIT